VRIKKYLASHPNATAALVLGALVLIFIAPSFFQGRFLAPVDTTHYVAPYLDITTQMLPWWKLSGELIKTGRLPFWNVFSGNGLPLLANMQSAIFFPLSWLFYILNVRFALFAYAFLKLFLMGMFTYFYLRELKLKHSSSLLGAILFAFCNANVIWFLWPLTSVILILPLSFFLIEKYFNSLNCVIPSPGTTGEESLKFGDTSTVKGSLGCTRDDTKGGMKYALWLAPVTTLGLFAGHPQTFFYIFCAIYGYTIFKAFSSNYSVSFRASGISLGLSRAEESLKLDNLSGVKGSLHSSPLDSTRGDPEQKPNGSDALVGSPRFAGEAGRDDTKNKLKLKNSIKHLIFLSAIYFLGFIISLIAVLPFLEYLKLSANLNYRAGFTENPFYLQPLMFLANIIPDFYGNTGVKNFSYLLVPNYGELTLGYIGISGFILAILAFGRRMRKQVWFFIALAVFCLALVYHAPIIYFLINKLPGFNLNYNNRLLYLWAFCASVLAAFGLENILNSKISRKRLNWTFAVFAIFAAILIIANRLATHGWQFAHNLDWHTVSLWQDVMIAAFFVNLIVSYFIIKKVLCHCEEPGLQLATKQSPPYDRLLRSDALPRNDKKNPTIFKYYLASLFILVSIETAIHGMVFMKTARPENFYPQEPALTYLQNQYTQNFYRVFTYGDNLLPNIGTWYHIDELNDHDTIYLTSNKQLKAAVGNYNYSPEYTFSDPNFNALRFLSTGYLLYPAQQGLDFLKSHGMDLSLAFSDNNYTILKLNNPLPRAFTIKADNIADLTAKLADLQQGKNLNLITPALGFTILEDGSENIVYNAPGRGYLVTTDNYYPGWAEEWGTQIIPVQNAMGLRAVAIPATGQNALSIRYHPKNDAYGWGWKLSLAALGLWLALYLWIAGYFRVKIS
jgi:hypothetical protein